MTKICKTCGTPLIGDFTQLHECPICWTKNKTDVRNGSSKTTQFAAELLKEATKQRLKAQMFHIWAIIYFTAGAICWLLQVLDIF